MRGADFLRSVARGTLFALHRHSHFAQERLLLVLLGLDRLLRFFESLEERLCILGLSKTLGHCEERFRHRIVDFVQPMRSIPESGMLRAGKTREECVAVKIVGDKCRFEDIDLI